MARKSSYDQILAAIDKARRPAPLGPPPPKKMPKTLTAPVYNANWTKAFEEEITGIYPGSWKNDWRGKVVNSFGRNGQTVDVWYNSVRQAWQYA